VIEPREEALLEENDQIRVRAEKRRRLEEEGVAVYPSAYPVTHTAVEAVAVFADGVDGPAVRVAGRVVSRRGMGRASFLHLQDRSGRVQVYLRRDAVGEEAYDRLTLLDLGDFVGVHGTMFRTKTGEVTVHVSEWTFLAKAMRPLPEKFHGLADKEIRFRQRYLDLIANEAAREIFRARSRIVSAMRGVLDGRDFLEVETPILQPVYGGANARPFRTEHNALGITLFLRIADELYLKRCLVGGLERVYEFGKDFRNEGMDKSHQPEFTMLEAYQAYADYRDGMELVEEVVRAAAVAANGSAVASWRGQSLDFGRPWARVPFFEALERETGRDLSTCDEARLVEACEEHHVDLAPRSSVGKMLDELFSATVQSRLVQPTFIVDHPKVLSPLSKEKPGGRGVVERYEPIVCGMEIGNGFSELNDPVEQRARFEAQLAMADRDDDTMVLDEAFLRALEHGMPPAAGFGIGLDRLVMILTGAEQIREVILFPAMRPEEGRSRDDGDEAEAEP
jgi:lysyl-tRNA synthetase class 2